MPTACGAVVMAIVYVSAGCVTVCAFQVMVSGDGGPVKETVAAPRGSGHHGTHEVRVTDVACSPGNAIGGARESVIVCACQERGSQ